jgi:hypothetical protein
MSSHISFNMESETPLAVSPTPPTVTMAAALLVTYGLWVVWRATQAQIAAGWVNADDYPRALIRLAGMGLIAFGLIRRQRWGWWLGVSVPVLLLLALIGGGMVAYSLAGGAGLASIATMAPDLHVAIVLLLISVILLLLPASREVFRTQRPQ